MAAGPWASANKKFHTEKVYNSVKVLSWHLSSQIFYNAVRPTHMMDCILGTMIVFSGVGKGLHRQTDTALHAACYALIMKYHAYANVQKPN